MNTEGARMSAPGCDLVKTYTARPTWVSRLSRWRFQSSLSSMEKAVMVSWPPRWRRRNGAHKAWMRWVRLKVCGSTPLGTRVWERYPSA